MLAIYDLAHADTGQSQGFELGYEGEVIFDE
jgi:hypothetical protein